MFTTDLGKFDGKTWEDFSQKCFKLKYEKECYQAIPADTGGDLGIEGYTKTGKVFQCYCPDNDTTAQDLHKHLTGKINGDLKKLEKNVTELGKYLNGTKIKEWILVTPKYRNKELIKYCKNKAKEYCSKKLPILDNKFDVLVHDCGFFTKEAPIVFRTIDSRIDLSAERNFSEEEIIQWREENILLTNNALSKFEKVIPANRKSKAQERANKMTSTAVQSYLMGNEVLRKWENVFPDRFEAFVRIISRYENKLAEEYSISEETNTVFYKRIEDELKEVIKREFPDLHTIMIDAVCDKIFYGWILECPLEFE